MFCLDEVNFFLWLISQFSPTVVSNSLQPHRLQHGRTPCPLPTPGVYLNSGALSWWCHLWFILSVQFSHSVVSNPLRPHELQHARPPCPSQTPGVYTNSCTSSQWWHPAISSSVVLFSSCSQSLSASGSFLMCQLFASRSQSIGVSASPSVLPMNTQDWSPLRWTGWISLQSKGLSRVS